MPDRSATGIGVSVKRKEDYRFLVGEGNYTDDINRPNQTYSYMFRSNTAHANFKIDVKDASNAKGVVKIFVGTDMEVGSIPCGWQVDSKDGTPMREPAHPPIAKDKVRYVGEILAVIIAESIEEAKNAAELIEVSFDEKSVIINMNDALDSSKGLVHEEIESNICYDWEIGDSEAVDTAMSNAAHITSLDIRNNRISRSKAVQLIKKDGFKIPKHDISKFCKLINISSKTFFKTCEKFRNKKIWIKNKNKKWVLKQPLK